MLFVLVGNGGINYQHFFIGGRFHIDVFGTGSHRCKHQDKQTFELCFFYVSFKGIHT
jgi:hypothetical protein